MALKFGDRVLETSTTTGTGAFSLAAAVTGYQRFSAVCSTSDTCYYAIFAVDASGNPSGDWETGLGTYSSANTLTRTTPSASTNGGSAVNFGAGTKYVMLTPTAGFVSGLGSGGGTYATASEYWVGTEAAKAVSPDTAWDAAVYVSLTDGATITPDFSTGINFKLTIGGNRTLAAPTNMKAGQTGVIAITQDGTGSRTLAFNSAWKFAGGSDPVLSTAIGAVDLLFYQVLDGAATVFGNLVKAIA